MLHTTYFILLVLCAAGTVAFLHETVADNKLDVTSNLKVIRNTYTALTVTCKFVPSEHAEVSQVLSLKVSKRPLEGDEFVELVTVTPQQIKDSDDFLGAVTGSVKNDGSDSVLNIEYPNPTPSDAGEYMCQSVGLDNSDLIVGSERSVTVWPVDNGYYTRSCMGGLPTANMTDLKDSIMDCGGTEEHWFETLRDITAIHLAEEQKEERSIKEVFGVTPLFNSDTFYIITHAAGIGFFQAADGICKTNNGYLGEINTEEEYLFLEKTLKTLGQNITHDYLITGNEFDKYKGRFVFHTHPEDSMYFGHWLSEQPVIRDQARYTTIYTWLALMTDKYGQVGMGVTAKQSDANYHTSHAYLCEVNKDR